MRNFVDESGLDWYALRRLPFATIKNMLPSIIDKSLLILPIPASETKVNSNVTQNPNYGRQ